MSILIKGAKMPKDCFGCPLYNLDHVCVILKRQNLAFDKPIDCPLVEIPPHGELIDKDKLINRCKQFKDMQFEHGETWEAGIDTCINIIEFHVPTVIESEDE